MKRPFCTTPHSVAFVWPWHDIESTWETLRKTIIIKTQVEDIMAKNYSMRKQYKVSFTLFYSIEKPPHPLLLAIGLHYYWFIASKMKIQIDTFAQNCRCQNGSTGNAVLPTLTWRPLNYKLSYYLTRHLFAFVRPRREPIPHIKWLDALRSSSPARCNSGT